MVPVSSLGSIDCGESCWPRRNNSAISCRPPNSTILSALDRRRWDNKRQLKIDYDVTFARALAFADSLGSMSGITIAFYTSSLDKKMKYLEKRLDLEEYEAARWKRQAEKMLEQLSGNEYT